MDDQIKNLVKKAKLKLFTNSMIFFGIVAHRFSWSFEKLQDDNVEAFVEFEQEDLSKLRNGTIHFNTTILSKPDYTHNNFIFTLCHELLHILNKHGLRKEDRDPRFWSVACDHVIEVFLREKLRGLIKPYKEVYNIIEELYYNYPNCSASFAYDWLMSHQTTFKITQNTEYSVDVFENGKYLFSSNLNIGGFSNTSPIESNESIKTLITNQVVAEARAIFENLKTRGTLPGQLTDYLTRVLKVEIPWETLVEKAIKNNVTVKPDERNWRILNKFFIPHNINLPGYSSTESAEGGIGTLITSLDSSASISTKDLQKFSYVVASSMNYYKEVILLVHDVTIHQEKKFNKDNSHEFYDFITSQGYQGRGGTSHICVFDKIAEYWEKDKDELSMVICLTDMYSDISSIYKNYGWIKNNLPLVFVITRGGDTYIDFDPMFGSISQIQIT